MLLKRKSANSAPWKSMKIQKILGVYKTRRLSSKHYGENLASQYQILGKLGWQGIPDAMNFFTEKHESAFLSGIRSMKMGLDSCEMLISDQSWIECHLPHFNNKAKEVWLLLIVRGGSVRNEKVKELMREREGEGSQSMSFDLT